MLILSNQPDILQTIQAWLDATKPGDLLAITAVSEAGVDTKSLRSDVSTLSRRFTLDQYLHAEFCSNDICLMDVLKLFSHEAIILSIQSKLAPIANVKSVGSVYKKSPVAQGIEIILQKRLKAYSRLSSPSKTELIERALRLYAAKEYEAVLDLLESHPFVAANSGDILNAAGASAFALKHPNRAIELYRRATVVMPNHYDAWNNLGIALSNCGNLHEAELAHRRAIDLRPKDVCFQGDLVKLLIRAGRLEEAEKICHAQLKKNSQALFFLGELGAIYTRQERPQEARECYGQIMAAKPGDEYVALNCGVRLFQAGYIEQAEFIYRNTIANHKSERAKFHLSLLLLAQGKFAEGWRLYEARSIMRKESLPEYQFPLWKGEAVHGKSLLITFEQGYGDEIMMVRYASELKAMGAARVAIICRRALTALFETIIGVEVLTPKAGDAILAFRDDEFDFWVLPFDIPRYINFMPTKVPYLKTPLDRARKWQKILKKNFALTSLDDFGFHLKVGLVWKGSTLHGADAERSLRHLEELAPLWDISNIQFFGLQKGQGEGEAQERAHLQPLVDLGPSIEDFADSAAIVDQLDLVIAVDTAIVHIAGSLNKPCWVLIPRFATDWRWMLDREDSPWYPSLRLFRQDCSGNWQKTITQIQQELASLVARHQSQILLTSK